MVEVFDGLSEKEAEKKARNWKRLLYKCGASKQVSKILQEFTRAWKERKGKIATVLSAEPLAEKSKKQFEEALSKKKYAMEEKVDPSVIGGVALFLGNDYVIDSTIRGKLLRLAKSLQRYA